MEKLKESHQQLSGVNLEELRVRVEEKDEVFAREVEVMRDLLAAKSREVDELLLEKRKVVAGYEQELEELRAQVAALEKITHQKQIEN
jgi:DNA-binding transcriptional MerR regulator